MQRSRSSGTVHRVIALQSGELPRLVAVLITHHHYDHCDLAAFAGDTVLIPELRTLPGRLARFDVALLPVNGPAAPVSWTSRSS